MVGGQGKGGGLIERGAYLIPSSKKWGAYFRGGILIKDIRYVC